MAEVAQAVVALIPSAKGFGKAVQGELAGDLAKTGAKEGNGLGSRIAGGFKTAAKAGFAGAGLLAGTALAKGFGRLKAIDDAEGKLQGLGHSTKAVDGIMGDALKSVKGTAFGLDEAASGAAGMVAAGIKPGKELQGVLGLVGDAATIAGTDFDSMSAIFGKVAATGKLQGDEILQLSEAGIPALQFLSKELGVSSAEVSDMASKGEIDFDTFARAMEGGLGGAAQASGKTFSGAWANMNAAMGRVGAALLSGLFPKLQGGFGGITAMLDRMTPAAERWGAALGTGISVVSQHIGGFVSNFRSGEGAAGRFRSILSSLWTSLSGAGSAAFAALRPHLVTFVNAMRGLWPQVKSLASSVGSFLVAAFQAAQPYLRMFAHVAGVVLVGAMRALPPILSVVMSALSGTLAVIRPLLPLLAAGAAAWGAYALAMKSIALAGLVRTLIMTGIQMVRVNAQAIIGIARYYAMAASTLAAAAAERARAAAQRVGLAVSKAALIVSLAWGRATNFATLATLRQTIAERARAVAMRVGAAATKAMALAQRVLNAAMRMNPIGLVITALLALGAGLVLAYKKSETFRRIVNGAWAGIKKAASSTVGWFKSTAWPWMKSVFSNIGGAALSLWSKYISPAFRKIGAIARSVFGWIKNTGWPWMRRAMSGIGAVIKFLWSRFFKPYFGFYLSIAKRVFGWVKDTGWPWMRKALSAIGGAAKSLWSKWIRPYFQFLLSKAQSVFGWIKNTGWPWMRKAFQAIGDKAKWLWGAAKTPFNKLKSGVGQVKDAIVKAKDGISKSWSKLNSALRSPIRKALTWMNDNFIGKLNSMLGKIKVSFRIPKIPGFSAGGYTGSGGKYDPAGIVHRDEFVVQKSSRQRFERDNPGALDHINRTGRLPGYAIGGKVKGLNKKFKEQLDRFNAAAGGRYTVNSGYRSVAHQRQLYNRYLAGKGPVAAKPGSSQHNKGLAADLAPSNARNVHGKKFAARYGLVYTVPSESWHIEPTWGRASNAMGALADGGGGWGLPDWVSDAAGWVKKKVASLTDGFKSDSPIVGGIIPKTFSHIQGAVTKKVKEAASLFEDSSVGMSMSGISGIAGTAKWRGTVLKALRILGLPSGLAGITLKRMNQESGGNARAINNWDINARMGNASRGLMQVIPPTFKAYRHPSYSSNIFDPLANILASMRYALSRYGGLTRAYGRKGGYAKGTDSATRGWHMVGENGPELVNFSGGQQVFNRDQTMRLARLASQAPAGGGGDPEVNVFIESDGVDLSEFINVHIEGAATQQRALSRMGA